MAAVNLLQLRKEINALLWKFTDPEAFEKELYELFEKYRSSRNPTGMAILLTMHSTELNVPLIVLRELEVALFNTVNEQPEAALKLSDRLLESETIEVRTIGARILGLTPIAYSSEVFRRIENWTHHDHPAGELRIFIRNAGSLVRRTDAERLLERARVWVQAPDVNEKELGIEVLIYLVEYDDFQNLPAVFVLLESLLRSRLTTLQPEITELVEKLLNRSVIETSYTIRLMLESDDPGVMTVRIARKLLHLFSEPSRSAIQKQLRQIGRTRKVL